MELTKVISRTLNRLEKNQDLEFKTPKKYVVNYLDKEIKKHLKNYEVNGWEEDDEDNDYGNRKYYSSNRLSKNKITMDTTKYTNSRLTKFECCICLKVKPVSQLLVDYLGRCIQCKHR